MGDRLPPRRPPGPMLRESNASGEYLLASAIFGLALIGGVAALTGRLNTTAQAPVPPLSPTLLKHERDARESCKPGADRSTRAAIFSAYACRRALHGMVSYLPEDRLEAVAFADFIARAERGLGDEVRELPRRIRPYRPLAKFSPGVDAVWRLQHAEQLEAEARRLVAREPSEAAGVWREARGVYVRLLASAGAFEKALKSVPRGVADREKAAALVAEAASSARAREAVLFRSEKRLREPRVLEALSLAERSPSSATPEACARLLPVAEKAPELESAQFEAGRLCFPSRPKDARAALERGLAAYAKGPVDPRTDERDAEFARRRLAELEGR